ncbi:hypothetical protein [Muribaculum sp. NM65_B17]|uniref:hypothetical protein n=1 Tax=Muribaculum sp. NM65_B17 TaxID=2516961 RepID=UPI001093E163|nr:hypothetical protein [Muribaculum sp. NM65_B17]TGY04449.1 hypothetical protein E5354_04880 [Muribaculum sp. NM65_B17]THG44232.1 hypothetical protein E5985_04045 [Muribaculaceae bacterium]
MKRLIRIFVIALVSIAMMVPPIEAQSRTTGNRNERSHSTQNSRPNNSGRPSNSSGRPGNNNNGHRPGNNGHRPGNNGGSNGHRPGNNNPGRPGNNNNGHRPGNNGHNPGRPGHGGYNPGRPHRPGGDYRPNRPHRPTVIVPPHRPHRPPMRPWSRPVPPPSWRPRPAAPVIASILGITFGTAINMSLDYLINRGYTIDGYGNDAVYLRDVNEMSYYWPDATLYYGAGGLARSEFLYSTSYPDPMRYNSLYTRFNRTYGPPINIVRTGGVLSATWFAPNRGYVTIDYRSQYSLGGDLRYFTTLTFGL